MSAAVAASPLASAADVAQRAACRWVESERLCTLTVASGPAWDAVRDHRRKSAGAFIDAVREAIRLDPVGGAELVKAACARVTEVLWAEDSPCSTR